MADSKEHVAYSKARESYRAYCVHHSFEYRVSRYGRFAEKLAKMSLSTGRRYEDYFEDNGDGTTTFIVNTKTYGEMKVLVDTEDAPKLFDKKISISKDGHAHTFYAKTKCGSVHRIIMEPKNPKEIVDHINRNGLDNRKANLRIVDTSINNRNANLRSDNKTGLKGVLEDEKRYRLYWYDENKQKHSKSFSKTKYGKEEALAMIEDFRNQVYAKYQYIA